MVAACPERILDYIELVTKTRSLLKRQSETWDMNDRTVRDRLYRLIYGGRAALEEVMLQAPAGSIPALILADAVPSVTPSYTVRGLDPSTAATSSYREAVPPRRPSSPAATTTRAISPTWPSCTWTKRPAYRASSKRTSRWGSWCRRSRPTSRTRSSGSWCFASGRISRR